MSWAVRVALHVLSPSQTAAMAQLMMKMQVIGSPLAEGQDIILGIGIAA